MTLLALRQALSRGGLAGDGAMGTALHALGIPFDESFAALPVARPEPISAIHRGHVKAGADVLRTSTFGADRARLGRSGNGGRVGDVHRAAALLASRAASGRAHVLGAIGPTGETTPGDEGRVLDLFAEQAGALIEAGVDGLLLETFRHPWEILIALRAARRRAGELPVLVTLSIDARGDLATTLVDLGARLVDEGADALGINCATSGDDVLAGVDALLPLGLPVLAVPSAGLPRDLGGTLTYPLGPADLGELARQLYSRGVALVGGCCGTTDEHVLRIAAARDACSPREVAERGAP